MDGIWWALQDLNLGPMDYESTALTAELRALLSDFTVESVFGSYKGYCRAIYAEQPENPPEGAEPTGVKRMTASAFEQKPRTPVWFTEAGKASTV